MTSSLTGLRGKIERQVPRLGRNSYSMQIVSLALGLIERDYGHREVNRAIEDFGLDELGWSKVDLRSGKGRRHETEARIENHKAELHATLRQVVEWAESGDLERLEVAIEKAADIARNIRYLGEVDRRVGGPEVGQWRSKELPSGTRGCRPQARRDNHVRRGPVG